VLVACFYFQLNYALWIEKTRYNPLCDVNKESSSDMLSEELVIDDDIINLETEGETARIKQRNVGK
jgi:hypothetical protein